MNSEMFTAQNLWLFFIASVMLNLTPGNDMIYVSSRTLSQGPKAGMISAAGIFIGCLVHTLAAILGLSVIIAKSAFLFGVIKYLGAAYLIYLGIKTLMTKTAITEIENLPPVNKIKLLRQGIITNILNPKVAIFFLSFLPQFVDPASPNLKFQLLTLGIWFDIQGALILVAVAWILGKTTRFIKRSPVFWNIQQKITGFVLVGLGIKIALTTKK
jgi:threonine/homoserine/homoserine lactone efflux protein